MEKKKRIRLNKISPTAWEHPADRAALAALRQIPAIDVILQNLFGLLNEKIVRLLFLASSVRVSDRQYPVYNKLLKEACDILDSHYIPELFIAQSPIMNAGALGVNKPFIVLNSSIVEKMTEEEVLAIIGHELGHCLSGHALYHTLLNLLILISRIVLDELKIPVPPIVFRTIIIALLEWYRKSELSADRAGLIVIQEANISYHVLMKLAGGTRTEQMNINEFFNQAADYEASDDIFDSIYKILLIIQQTHPFPVLRLTELKTWIDRGDYDKILSGDYKQRGDKEDVKKDFEDASKQYSEDLKKSKDPLTSSISNTVDDILTGINKASGDFQHFFDSLFKNSSEKKDPADKSDKKDE